MKRVIFGIFAHPDDEAFGPSGTLLMETKAGTELHLITLTLGEAGVNPDGVGDLAAEREREWQEAGRLIGATTMTNLGYSDSRICNQSMQDICSKLVEHISAMLTNYDDNTEVEMMSIDLNGVTGHIDHIACARAACCAFYRLKEQDGRMKRIRLACIPRSLAPQHNTDWIYMDAGRTDEEIDEVVDAREYRDEIIAIMQAHRSQRADGNAHIEALGDTLGINHFVVKS